jgi:prepilin-type N-terminal cleavage/methylation domain-containing protein/prepilin-type processing-associated H-X9-DG protein
MTPSHPFRCGLASRRMLAAFTLTELLVVLAVVALLVTLRLPALARVKTQTWITQCSGNLRQIDLSFLLYANESNGSLPNFNSGFWPWDLPDSTFQALNHVGNLQSNMLYCPSMPYQQLLWNYEGSAHITGYVYALLGTGSGGSYTGSYSTNINSTVPPPQLQLQGPGNQPIIVPRASTRPLVADAEICAGPGPYVPTQPLTTYNFSNVTGGAGAFPDGRHHRASHLAGMYPLGGNLGMLDGHVEWRAFRSPTYNMIQRNASQPPNGTPCFLW